MTKTLAFVEYPGHIQPVLARLGKAEASIIALSPSVECALERLAVPYRRPEDYCDEDELEEFGVGNFQTVERLSEYLDRHWQARLPYLAAHSLRPAWSSLLELKIFYDAVTVRLYQLLPILESERPDRVVFCRTEEHPFSENLRWSQEESIFAHLLGLLCSQQKISMEIVDVPGSTVYNKQAIGRSPVAGGLKRYFKQFLIPPGFHPLIYVFRQLGWVASFVLLFRASMPGSKGPRILLNTLEYSLPWALASLLKRRSLRLWLWEEGGTPSRLGGMRFKAAGASPDATCVFSEGELQKVWQELRAEPELRRFFVLQGIDWFPVAEKRLRLLSTGALERFASFHRVAAYWLQRLQPAAVVFSLSVGLWRRALIQAAKEERLPVVVLPHGEVGSHFLHLVCYEDFLVADSYLAYGPGVVEYLRRRYPCLEKRMKAIPTGAPMIDGLPGRTAGRDSLCRRFGLDPGRRTVVYVLTKMDGNSRVVSYYLRSDSTRFRIEKRIAAVLGACHEVQFVLKMHPNPLFPRSPIVEYLSDAAIRNCMVIEECPFEKMVSLADAFVIDSPSTALLQMMTTDVPIYIFNDIFRWEPAAMDALGKRAYLFDDLDAFCRQLGSDLDSGRCFEKNLVDTTFLRLYGLPEEGAAADNCANAIIDAALGGS